MTHDHKAAKKYAKAQIDFYKPACTEDSNIAICYLDKCNQYDELVKLAKAVVAGIPDTWDKGISLREHLEGK